MPQVKPKSSKGRWGTPTGNRKAVPMMDFFAALEQVAMGRTITKREWGDDNIHCRMVDGYLSIKGGTTGDDNYHAWLISDGDMVGEDWEVVSGDGA